MSVFLVHSIPADWRVEYVRHFFTNAVEAGWFDLFHFKARALEGLEYEGPLAAHGTHACVIRIKPAHENDVLRRYHNKRVRVLLRMLA